MWVFFVTSPLFFFLFFYTSSLLFSSFLIHALVFLVPEAFTDLSLFEVFRSGEQLHTLQHVKDFQVLGLTDACRVSSMW